MPIEVCPDRIIDNPAEHKLRRMNQLQKEMAALRKSRNALQHLISLRFTSLVDTCVFDEAMTTADRLLECAMGAYETVRKM